MGQQVTNILVRKNVELRIIAEREEAKRLHKAGNKRAAIEYFNNTHRYQLELSGKKVPIFKRMLGIDAKTMNAKFNIRYGSGSHKRLHKWVWLKKEEKQSKQAAAAILAMRK